MSAAGFRQSVMIPAVPEQVRTVRVFVARVLGESHTDVDLALLLSSELVTNSVRHSGSAVPGGGVTVTVVAGEKVVRVEVTDRIGDGVPVLTPAAPAGDEAEESRGLRLVDALAARWGYQRGGGLATTADLLAVLRRLADDLSEAVVVIVKGDLNYRRLVGDAHWDPTGTPAGRRHTPGTLPELYQLVYTNFLIGLDHMASGTSTDSARGPETTGNNRDVPDKCHPRGTRPNPRPGGPVLGSTPGISAPMGTPSVKRAC